MPAPIGNQYAVGNKGGRPRIWTDERLDDLILKLEEWVKKDDSLLLVGFLAENDLTKDQFDHLKTYEVFSDALFFVKCEIAVKMIKKLNNRELHPAVFHRYIAFYDDLLNEFEKEAKEHSLEEFAQNLKLVWKNEPEEDANAI